MSRTDFATSPGQEDGIKACHLGTLGLDILALDTAHNSPFLVDLQRYKALDCARVLFTIFSTKFSQSVTNLGTVFIKIITITKDEFKIELRYAHKKKLRQTREKNHVLEMDHHRALKFENFLFFYAF